MENPKHICLICRQCFPAEKALVEHINAEHSHKKEGKFNCSECKRSFRDSYNLNRHVTFMHSSKTDVKQTNTICPLCSKVCLKRDIINHFSSVHQIQVEEERLEFSTEELFENWKIQLEKDTKSRYVKVRNIYKYKDGSTLNTFYCHRDGFVKLSKSKNLRKMKSSGSNKINGHCPSKMVVKTSYDKSVVVKFVRTHIGHTGELNRISLNKKEKEALAEKLSMNIPFDQILDDIRDSIKDSDLERVHLLSKQDLRNIVRDFKVKKEKKIPQDNAHFDLSLNPLLSSDSNFIRLYKPKGTVSNDYPPLKSKDFLLLIMNDMQKEMLDKYGNRYICIDLTRGVHLHDLDLYTLYVIDDAHEAFPCAFGFSNRCDIVAMELFLLGIQDIMKRILIPNLLITNEMLHDAWCAVMSSPRCHIYCIWQVDYDWRHSLKKIQDKEKQTIIYRQLRNLLEEEDVETFKKNLENLYCHLQSNDNTKDFSQYFEMYKNSCEKWAFCYRKHLGNSLSDLEKLHKSLKYIYLKRKLVHSIEDTICNIMSFLRAKYLEHPNATVLDKLMEVKNGHKNAINMTQANLTKINDTSWDVSDSISEKVFHVEQVKSDCDNCLLKCMPCSVCLHLFTCTCYESIVKWNMCQHIHLVCIVAKHEQSLVFKATMEQSLKLKDDLSSECDTTFAGNDSDSEQLAIIHHVNAPIKSDTEIEMRKKEILNKFTIILQNATSLEQLDLIEKHLTPCEQLIKFGVNG